MPNYNPKTAHLTQRDLDDYLDMPLAKAPLAVRLPQEIIDHIKSKGMAWYRNLVITAVLADINSDDLNEFDKDYEPDHNELCDDEDDL